MKLLDAAAITAAACFGSKHYHHGYLISNTRPSRKYVFIDFNKMECTMFTWIAAGDAFCSDVFCNKDDTAAAVGFVFASGEIDGCGGDCC